jgi:hypothetical protein
MRNIQILDFEAISLASRETEGGGFQKESRLRRNRI